MYSFTEMPMSEKAEPLAATRYPIWTWGGQRGAGKPFWDPAFRWARVARSQQGPACCTVPTCHAESGPVCTEYVGSTAYIRGTVGRTPAAST